MTETDPTPRIWTAGELENAALAATTDFVTERQAEGGEAYRALFAEARTIVEQLFDATNDLSSMATGGAFVRNPAFIDAGRYLDGPPISADDLKTIIAVGGGAGAHATVEQIAGVVMSGLDRERVPWLFDEPQRGPTATERDLAIRWTAGLWAVQRAATRRRGEASGRQEAAVKDLFREHGYEEVARRPITMVDSLERGQFCPEAPVNGTRCDIPVRLRNGYLLLIECKVSSTAINSYKRLNHECGDKATRWRARFAEQALPMAVLAGVFRPANLITAQNEQNIYLAWERDLRPLSDFVDRSG